MSYRRVHGKYVELTNDTKLLIAEIGTAKFSLNEKVIVTKNCMHVVDLQALLYSLRRHCRLPGCGTVSHCDSGSYVLFLTFSLHVDDSVDHMLSYRSIRRELGVPWCDYVEPRLSITLRAGIESNGPYFHIRAYVCDHTKTIVKRSLQTLIYSVVFRGSVKGHNERSFRKSNTYVAKSEQRILYST